MSMSLFSTTFEDEQKLKFVVFPLMINIRKWEKVTCFLKTLRTKPFQSALLHVWIFVQQNPV